MRTLKFIALLLIFFLLTACSANPEAADHYAKREEFNVNIIAPQSIEADSSSRINLQLKKQGELTDKEATINFLIWKDDHKAAVETIPSSLGSDGMYYFEYVFPSEGIYFVKADIKVADSHVMPTKQIRVGKLSNKDLKRIQEEETHMHHNHGTNGKHH